MGPRRHVHDVVVIGLGVVGSQTVRALGISNINDDLSVPATATPGSVDTNTWHAAQGTDLDVLDDDVGGEILEVCTRECAQGPVAAYLRNMAPVSWRRT